ncbi:hypothetical protein ACFL0V_03695 [Nanoarchaeota archaeon]
MGENRQFPKRIFISGAYYDRFAGRCKFKQIPDEGDMTKRVPGWRNLDASLKFDWVRV